MGLGELLPMARRSFKGFIARNVPKVINASGVHPKMQQFLLSIDQVKQLCSKMVGIPICAEHEEKEVIGRCTGVRTMASKEKEDTLDVEVDMDLDTDVSPSAQDAAALMDLGYSMSLSLSHDPNDMTPVEITQCQTPARDGSVITAGRLPIDPKKIPVYNQYWQRIQASLARIRASRPSTDGQRTIIRATLSSSMTAPNILDGTLLNPEPSPIPGNGSLGAEMLKFGGIQNNTGGAPQQSQQQPPLSEQDLESKRKYDEMIARRKRDADMQQHQQQNQPPAPMAALSSPPAALPPVAASSREEGLAPFHAPAATMPPQSSANRSEDPLMAMFESASALTESGFASHANKMKALEDMKQGAMFAKELTRKNQELEAKLAAAQKSHLAVHQNAWQANEQRGFTPPGTADRMTADINNGSLDHAKQMASQAYTQAQYQQQERVNAAAAVSAQELARSRAELQNLWRTTSQVYVPPTRPEDIGGRAAAAAAPMQPYYQPPPPQPPARLLSVPNHGSSQWVPEAPEGAPTNAVFMNGMWVVPFTKPQSAPPPSQQSYPSSSSSSNGYPQSPYNGGQSFNYESGSTYKHQQQAPPQQLASPQAYGYDQHHPVGPASGGYGNTPNMFSGMPVQASAQWTSKPYEAPAMAPRVVEDPHPMKVPGEGVISSYGIPIGRRTFYEKGSTFVNASARSAGSNFRPGMGRVSSEIIKASAAAALSSNRYHDPSDDQYDPNEMIRANRPSEIPSGIADRRREMGWSPSTGRITGNAAGTSSIAGQPLLGFVDVPSAHHYPPWMKMTKASRPEMYELFVNGGPNCGDSVMDIWPERLKDHNRHLKSHNNKRYFPAGDT
jgi:hypothetical protein